jgi:hypothetical protein
MQRPDASIDAAVTAAENLCRWVTGSATSTRDRAAACSVSERQKQISFTEPAMAARTTGLTGLGRTCATVATTRTALTSAGGVLAGSRSATSGAGRTGFRDSVTTSSRFPTAASRAGRLIASTMMATTSLGTFDGGLTSSRRETGDHVGGGVTAVERSHLGLIFRIGAAAITDLTRGRLVIKW